MGEAVMLTSSEKLDLVVFAPQDVERYWDSIEGSLDLIPHTWTLSREETKSQILEGKLQVWSVADRKKLKMILFTQIVDDALQVVWACGDAILADALPLLDAGLDDFARHMGVKRLEIIGRKGWERALAPLGFKLDRIILSRPVVDIKVN